MSALLYSAPEEYYLDHISMCMEKFELLFPVFYSATFRTLNASVDRKMLKDSFSKMILFHDLGKLTQKWQEILSKEMKGNKNLNKPSHSTLGAAYLWKVLPAGVKEPISFAVAIHHTDRGLLGDNIEKPDVQAILDGVVDNEGNIKWHKEALNLKDKELKLKDKKLNLKADLFPEDAKELSIEDLRDMARGLRIWAKGCGILEQHQRRIQASLAHHILKLCDVSAATERREYQKKDNQDYYGGWLMVENIKNYVENIKQRGI